MPDGTATAHLFKPKLLTTFSEGYGLAAFRADALAALTVAIVALPLSMAIAVASGVTPERGLYAAIVGGFFVSALGGSRWQIGGPAGAFIVVVAGAVAQFGVEGVLVIVIVSGVLLTLLGLTRLGLLVRYIPHAVTVGFTCAIAVIIFASQLRDFSGLTVSGAEPGPLLAKLAALARAIATVNPVTLAVGAACVAAILMLRRLKPHWPVLLIAVAAASAAVFAFHLPVETIGSRFGGVPQGLPSPRLPDMNASMLGAMLPAIVTFTLLGGIESLLSAKVADGMTGRKHRPNMELLAQGIANVASALFGGISVTGTIARTATNIRAGAKSPLAGIMHAAFLLVFIVVAAPLTNYIPLTALAAVLLVVAWDMVEKKEFGRLLHDWRTAAVLLATFGLTLLTDLLIGIVAGCVVAAVFALLGKALRKN
jgi:SulP family sulfate permease